MNHFAVQQNGFAACEEVRGAFSTVIDRKFPVFCPKPRHLGNLLAPDPIRPPRLQLSHHADLSDSAASADILSLILTKDSYSDVDLPWGNEMDSSPPFFCGSPPSRASNPLVHDARFLEEKPNTPFTPLPFLPPVPSTPPSASTRQVGCFRNTNNIGPKQAMVRIEGFDCLNRDRSGCSIPAFA